eukprot:CAMPEP_0194746348 /NCGR_PEP_ID=MMETSP0323_2-20130528/252_1 /TAXON_ID=2866 ORGANISM="Crypthecodinium cohnii, Strain Seligo" /NCGR_SAMPLE_ID=MMETSP0323_2 /ASSEMBLY_ACC=CAM_ASM_000346 /LENGTH=80 /DNA_ID=CAMNT_0039658761 /DNA_START=53 /DNA_END=293 /DNA_ORIENTATION=+
MSTIKAQPLSGIDEADLLGLLAELLALHEDAVLADQAHASGSARDTRDALALGAGKATHREDEGVLLDFSVAATTNHGGV